MRVTNSILFRAALTQLADQREALARTQEQGATALRINRPSDDPVGVRAAALLRNGIAMNDQFERNIVQSRVRISGTESALESVTDVLVRARELAIQGSNDATGAEGRLNIAAEIETLREQLLSDANRRVNNAYIFAGYASGQEPFVDGVPVTFIGDSTEIRVAIDEGVSLQVSLDGRRVFMGDSLDDGIDMPDADRANLFEVLADLRDALNANDGDAIRATLPQLDTGISQVSRERTTIGAADTQATLWTDRHRLRDEELRSQLSSIEDADSIEVFSTLVQQEATLQASLNITSRILQFNLMDFV